VSLSLSRKLRTVFLARSVNSTGAFVVLLIAWASTLGWSMDEP
jgi:hypothetical protein